MWLEGSWEHTRSWARRIRTQQVDVDAQGHPCKVQVTGTSYRALCEQHESQHRLHLSQRYAEERSEMSMDTETVLDDREEQSHDADVTPRGGFHDTNRYSDGSNYVSLRLAGYATVGTEAGRQVVRRKHIPIRPAPKGPNIIIPFEPHAVTSFTPEVAGLLDAMYEEADLAPNQRAPEIRTDSTAAICVVEKGKCQDEREHQRTTERFAIARCQAWVAELDQKFQWVKGHSGIPPQEKADRHAARACFRHFQNPGRFAPETRRHEYVLLWYENPVVVDIRSHIIAVCKERWRQRWMAHPSQGSIVRGLYGNLVPTPALHSSFLGPAARKSLMLLANNISDTPYRRFTLSTKAPKADANNQKKTIELRATDIDQNSRLETKTSEIKTHHSPPPPPHPPRHGIETPANPATPATNAVAEREDEETMRCIHMAICATKPRDDPTTISRPRPARPTPSHTMRLLPSLNDETPRKTPDIASPPPLRNDAPRTKQAKCTDCGAFPSNCTCQATINTRPQCIAPSPTCTSPTPLSLPNSPRSITGDGQFSESQLATPVGSDDRLDPISLNLQDGSAAPDDTNEVNNDGSCPLCHHPKADKAHILWNCPATQVLRTKRNDELTKLMEGTHRNYLETHQIRQAPVTMLPCTLLYPFATQILETSRTLTLEGLPESAWYRRSKGWGKQAYITLQFPSNYPVGQCQALYGREAPRTHIRVLARVFWDLLHDHNLTDCEVVEPTKYIKRAADIYMLVVACQNQSGPSSVCWAQPTNLQHIASDLVGCDHELFCNPANRNSTCFTTHQCFFSPDGIEGVTPEEYTQTLLSPFNKSNNMHYNGLQKALFDGSKHRFLTGNPPFDGHLGGTTIRNLLDLCQLATLGTTHAFRALLLLPLSHAELQKRKLEGATVLMIIPNDTVKFTPAGYLFATAPRVLKTYKEANTTLVYLMYQNDLAVQMRPINRGSLNRHLAAWFISERDGTEETLVRDMAATTLDLTSFRMGEPSLPPELRFWEPNATCDPFEYVGANIDAQCEFVTPVRDIINWDRNLAVTGCLPDSFPKLLAALRHSPDSCSATQKKIQTRMRATTLEILSVHRQLCRAHSG